MIWGASYPEARNPLHSTVGSWVSDFWGPWVLGLLFKPQGWRGVGGRTSGAQAWTWVVCLPLAASFLICGADPSRRAELAKPGWLCSLFHLLAAFLVITGPYNQDFQECTTYRASWTKTLTMTCQEAPSLLWLKKKKKPFHSPSAFTVWFLPVPQGLVRLHVLTLPCWCLAFLHLQLLHFLVGQVWVFGVGSNAWLGSTALTQPSTPLAPGY